MKMPPHSQTNGLVVGPTPIMSLTIKPKSCLKRSVAPINICSLICHQINFIFLFSYSFRFTFSIRLRKLVAMAVAENITYKSVLDGQTA